MNHKQRPRRKFVAMVTTLMLLVFTVFTPQLSPVYAETVTTKIMPLGDSITDCDFWRTLLFNKLADNGYDVQSVGSRYGGHEGHWGIRVTDIAKYNQLVPWLDAANPDIIIMHLGTNDCWQDIATSEIIDAYTILLEQMRANNPNMILVVAQIIPLHPDDAIDYDANVTALNTAIVDWVAEHTTEASPIIICDQYTEFDVDVDTYDGAHPSTSGSQKICDNWYDALVPILLGDLPTVDPTIVPTTEPTVDPTIVPTVEPTVAPTAVPTTEPTVEPTVEPTIEPTVEPTVVPGESALVIEPVISSWGSGYTVTMNVKNISNETVSDWELVLEKDDFEITNIWCAEQSEEDDVIIIKPMAWNSTIAPGSSVSFGFQGIGEIESDFSYSFR